MSLFLIRRNLSTYIGPYTYAQVQKYARSVHCSPQDEISKSCNKWVRVTDSTRIKKYYPELANVFAGDEKIQDISSVTAKPKSGSKILSHKLTIATVILLIIGLGSTVAYIEYQKINMTNKGFEYYSQLLNSNPSEFKIQIESKLPEIIKKLDSDVSSFEKWLPFLRAYAFMFDGELNGLSKVRLYGQKLPLQQQDCTLDYWKKQWDAAQPYLPEWVGAKLNLDVDWARLLFWDPQWIKDHSDPNWIKPISLYAGCIDIALLALESFVKKSEINKQIQNRLLFMQAIIKNTASPAQMQFENNLLSLLNCHDKYISFTELYECRSLVSTENVNIIQTIDYRFLTRLIQLDLSQIKTTEFEEYISKINEMKNIAPFYLFNYQIEIQNFQKIIGTMPTSNGSNDGNDNP